MVFLNDVNGGGNATFGANSVLNLEILGGTPGSQYDRMYDLNTFSFNGTLNLIFGNGYAPTAGETFSLFGYAAFGGVFDPAKINVTGFDRSFVCLIVSLFRSRVLLGATLRPLPNIAP